MQSSHITYLTHLFFTEVCKMLFSWFAKNKRLEKWVYIFFLSRLKPTKWQSWDLNTNLSESKAHSYSFHRSVYCLLNCQHYHHSLLVSCKVLVALWLACLGAPSLALGNKAGVVSFTFHLSIESKHEVTILGGLNEFVVKFYGPQGSKYMCWYVFFYFTYIP